MKFYEPDTHDKDRIALLWHGEIGETPLIMSVEDDVPALGGPTIRPLDKFESIDTAETHGYDTVAGAFAKRQYVTVIGVYDTDEEGNFIRDGKGDIETPCEVMYLPLFCTSRDRLSWLHPDFDLTNIDVKVWCIEVMHMDGGRRWALKFFPTSSSPPLWTRDEQMRLDVRTKADELIQQLLTKGNDDGY